MLVTQQRRFGCNNNANTTNINTFHENRDFSVLLRPTVRKADNNAGRIYFCSMFTMFTYSYLGEPAFVLLREDYVVWCYHRKHKSGRAIHCNSSFCAFFASFEWRRQALPQFLRIVLSDIFTKRHKPSYFRFYPSRKSAKRRRQQKTSKLLIHVLGIHVFHAVCLYFNIHRFHLLRKGQKRKQP